ncbi:MAG: response regulator [Leptolyngbyaceae cyanobacterium bins.349]|nr:response regulator [Leptolyngbyaceae cyanobacterium bins.349]
MPARLILLINHDASIGEVIRVCLMHLAGWDVISVGLYQTDLETLVQERPDAILVDAFLPKINGLGFIQGLFIQKLQKTQITQSVPILLMTDKADWFTVEQLRSLGIEGAIAKPFDPKTLPTQIARILGWERG